jgi:hypothetical protein
MLFFSFRGPSVAYGMAFLVWAANRPTDAAAEVFINVLRFIVWNFDLFSLLNIMILILLAYGSIP